MGALLRRQRHAARGGEELQHRLRRLVADHPERAVGEHEARARVRRPPAGIAQVECLVEPALAPVRPEEAELDPDVVVAHHAHRQEANDAGSERDGTTGLDPRARGEIGGKLRVPAHERQVGDALQQPDEQRGHDARHAVVVVVTPADVVIAEPVERDRLLGGQQPRRAVHLRPQLYELHHRPRLVGHLRARDARLDADRDPAARPLAELEEEPEGPRRDGRAPLRPRRQLGDELLARPRRVLAFELRPFAVRHELARQPAAGARLDLLREPPAHEVGVRLGEDLGKRRQVPAEPARRTTGEQAFEGMLALPSGRRRSQTIERRRRLRARRFAAALRGGARRDRHHRAAAGTDRPFREELGEPGIDETLLRVRDLEEAARERVRVLAVRTDRAGAARRDRADPVPRPRGVVDLGPVHRRAEGVVLEDQPADTALARVLLPAVPRHGRERPQLRHHAPQDVARRHATVVRHRPGHRSRLPVGRPPCKSDNR